MFRSQGIYQVLEYPTVLHDHKSACTLPITCRNENCLKLSHNTLFLYRHYRIITYSSG